MFAGATHIRREPVTFADIRPSPSIDHSAQVSNTALGPKIISFLFYDPIATPSIDLDQRGSRLPRMVSNTHLTGDLRGHPTLTLPERKSLGVDLSRVPSLEIHYITVSASTDSNQRRSRLSRVVSDTHLVLLATLSQFPLFYQVRAARLSIGDGFFLNKPAREWMVSASTKPNFGVKFPIGKSLRCTSEHAQIFWLPFERPSSSHPPPLATMATNDGSGYIYENLRAPANIYDDFKDGNITYADVKWGYTNELPRRRREYRRCEYGHQQVISGWDSSRYDVVFSLLEIDLDNMRAGPPRTARQVGTRNAMDRACIRPAASAEARAYSPVVRFRQIFAWTMRTKQTAKKSTGGPAPRKPLGPKPNKKLAASQPTARDAKKRKRVDEEEAAERMQPPVGSRGFTEASGDRVNSWCSGCEEGGKLLQCTLCPRSFCDVCLVFPVAVTTKMNWYCPRCWMGNGDGKPNPLIPSFIPIGGGGKKIQASREVPYQGPFANGAPLGLIKYGGEQQQRGMWAVIDCPPLAVISIRLAGMTLDADPASAILTRLHPFYAQQPLLFIDLSYNLDEEVEQYDDAVEAATTRLLEYRPAKVLVIFTGHTVPDTGLIHTAPGGASSSDAAEVLPRLIPEELQAVIRGARTSLLVLLACGALHSGDAREEVSEFVQSSGFTNAIGFSVAKFLPGTGATFLQETVLSLFINPGAQKFSHLLANHGALGQHTDIVLYQGAKEAGTTHAHVYEYSWTHPIRKPFGQTPPAQCPKCGRIKVWDLLQFTEDLIRHGCRYCDEVSEYKCSSCRLIKGAWRDQFNQRGPEGAWVGRWIRGQTAAAPPPTL
ncbi:hypothetical protein C8R43DRAFT_1128741 [Mycena crocata]|nr:hypothetical protein C8R43DRAFT_1128741 [Mycena crocata]